MAEECYVRTDLRVTNEDRSNREVDARLSSEIGSPKLSRSCELHMYHHHQFYLAAVPPGWGYRRHVRGRLDVWSGIVDWRLVGIHYSLARALWACTPAAAASISLAFNWRWPDYEWHRRLLLYIPGDGRHINPRSIASRYRLYHVLSLCPGRFASHSHTASCRALPPADWPRCTHYNPLLARHKLVFRHLSYLPE